MLGYSATLVTTPRQALVPVAIHLLKEWPTSDLLRILPIAEWPRKHGTRRIEPREKVGVGHDISLSRGLLCSAT